MTRRSQRAASIAALVLGVAALVVFPYVFATDDPAQEVGITDYQGERLGSVDDFRENPIAGIQAIDPEAYFLRVDGLVSQTASFTLPDLAGFPRAEKLVTLRCVEGWSVKALWEGIPLAELLSVVQPAPQPNMVVFHAVDGYTTSLPLDLILDRNLIIADRINGITLPPARGFPFLLVAEEKWGYKWIRWLTRIELSDDPEYRGFWERRGYDNNAHVDGPIFESAY